MVSSTPRPHFTPGKDPVPILQEAGWVPGPIWTDGKSRPHRDSIPDRPARSQPLYRLSYRAHTTTSVCGHLYNLNTVLEGVNNIACSSLSLPPSPQKNISLVLTGIRNKHIPTDGSPPPPVLLQNFEICGNRNTVKAKLNLADMGSERNEAAVGSKRPTQRRNKLVPRLLIGPDT